MSRGSPCSCLAWANIPNRTVAVVPLLLLWRNTVTKGNVGEERGYCSLQFQVTVHHWGKLGYLLTQGRNLMGVQLAIPHSITSDRGTYFTTKEVEQEQQRMTLAGRLTSQIILSWLSYITQFHLLGRVLSTVLGLPTSINKQGNLSHP